MSGGFANPVVDQTGNLQITSVQSPGFSLGPPIVGWQIDKNGQAFFQSISVGGGQQRIYVQPNAPPWSFTVAGTPVGQFFTVSTAQSASIVVGNQFTDTFNPGTVFTVTAIGAPFGGFVNVSFTPNAPNTMNNPDVVTEVGPSLNDLWINTSNNNQLNQWNGSAWVAVQWGTNALANGAVTLAILAAGIIYAGIVNGTIIQGATFKLVNSFGAVDGLWDSGTDALYIYADTGSATQGGVQAAIAAKAVADPVNNSNVPQGLFSQQLTLANQAVDPPAFANASVFFSTVAGRPAYKSSAGARNIIERSDLNVAGFSVGNTTTPGTISATLTYQSNEGAQGSEYEIEVDLTVTTGSGTQQTLAFQLALDGVLFGPHITIGAIAFAANSTYFITLRGRVTLTNPAGLTAQVSFDGGMSKSANVGSESAFPVINNSMQVTNGAVTFDPTVNHTIQMFAQWGGTNTGELVNNAGGRTKITRRF